MALHRDFMMRMIEKLAAAFFQIVAGKAVDAPEQALIDIEELVAETLGTSREWALGLGPEAIDNVDPALASELARLLLLHAVLSEEVGRADRALRARRMGFRAIERALERPATGFARLAADQLREHLEPISEMVSAEVLAHAYMAAHRTAFEAANWDDAEDWAFFALEVHAFPHLDEVLRFYARLLDLSDDALEAGGLTREEVAESVSELTSFES